jgi:hypothetical protein
MAASIHALIYPHQPNSIVERRMIDLANVPEHKQSWWRPVVVVGDDAFDSLTHKKTGPVVTIEANQVVDTFSVVALTAEEISARKDVAVNGLNNSDYKPLLQILLTVANDIRDVRAKINAEATASSHAAPYTAGQVSSINMTQLKAAIKALL